MLVLPALLILCVAAPAFAQKATPYTGRPSSLSFWDALVTDMGSAVALASRQLSLPFKIEAGLPVLVAFLSAAAVLAWPIRIWLLGRFAAVMKREHRNTNLAVYAKAVGAIVLTTILFAVAGIIGLAALELTLPLFPEVRTIARSLAGGIGIVGFALGVGRALRSPDDKSRRPVQMPSGLGRVIGFYSLAAGLALGLTAFVDQTSRVLQATTTTWTMAQALIVVVEAALIARFLILAGRARERQAEAVRGSDGGSMAIPAAFGMTAIAWAALAAGILALLFGHTRFAMLVMQELLWVALVLTTAWLLTRFLTTLVERLLDTGHRAGRFATSVVGVRQARVAQAALLGSAVLTVVVWLLAIALVAAPLQSGGAPVAEQVRPGSLMRSLQSLNISPRSLFWAFAILFGGLALTRMFRRWLENRYLPVTALDVGARTSIVTGLGYTGAIIAMLGATSALGVQLEKITLIASALSVGIGFGLQSIIQNFVSGLILLIERPVQPGDWVSVSGAEGSIRRIRVRATELLTADGGVSIVPNSAFISSTVANRDDPLMATKLELALSVSGCPSPTAAHDALSNLLLKCEAVRQEPEPKLYLRTLGRGEWTFDARLYGNRNQSVQQLRSDLLFWLSERSTEKDISIKVA